MSRKQLSRIGIALSASVIFHASAISACSCIAARVPTAAATGGASRIIMDTTRKVRLLAADSAVTAGAAVTAEPIPAQGSSSAPKAQAEPAETIARDVAPGNEPMSGGDQISEDVSLTAETSGDGASEGGEPAPLASLGSDPIALAGADFKRLFAAALVFPEAARRTGKTGSVGIIASVAADGRILTVRVSSSSGSAALDAAARKAAVSIAEVTAPGRPIDLSLRAVFARGTASLEP